MTDVQLISVGDAGHRREYVAQLLAEFHKLGIGATITARADILHRGPLLFMAIEDHPQVFVSVAALRSALGLRTVGLMFRPGQCFTPGSARHAVKRLVFRVLSRLPGTAVLTLLPHDIDQRFSTISTGWIYDPQLWDFATYPHRQDSELTDLHREIRERARERRIVVALGDQHRSKGFEFLSQLATRLPRDRVLLVAAGRVAPTLEQTARLFVEHGGMLCNRLLTDHEFLGMYAIADFVWCCYAPEYDQASGIFGRAFQFGVPAIVRARSYLVDLALRLGHPTIAIDPSCLGDGAEVLAAALERSAPRNQPGHIESLRRISLGSLVDALHPAGHAEATW
jgi:hypothetical protein